MFGVLAADIDAGDPPVGRVIAAAQACVGRGVEALVYASRGAKPTERKWRVL
ncbi:hypothetical protein SAMN04488026_1004149, partial [Aliiruegeria lutimaris]